MIGKFLKEYGKRKQEFLEEKTFGTQEAERTSVISTNLQAFRQRVLITIPSDESKSLTPDDIEQFLSAKNAVRPARISKDERTGGFFLIFENQFHSSAFFETFKGAMEIGPITVRFRPIHIKDAAGIVEEMKMDRRRSVRKQNERRKKRTEGMFPRDLDDPETFGGLLYPSSSMQSTFSDCIPALRKVDDKSLKPLETAEHQNQEDQSSDDERESAANTAADEGVSDFLMMDDSDGERSDGNANGRRRDDDDHQTTAEDAIMSEKDTSHPQKSEQTTPLPSHRQYLRKWWEFVPPSSQDSTLIKSDDNNPTQQNDRDESSLIMVMKHKDRPIWNHVRRGLTPLMSDPNHAGPMLVYVQHVWKLLMDRLYLPSEPERREKMDRMFHGFGPFQCGLQPMRNTCLPRWISKKDGKGKKMKKMVWIPQGLDDPQEWPTVSVALMMNLSRCLEDSNQKRKSGKQIENEAKNNKHKKSEMVRETKKQCEILSMIAQHLCKKESNYQRRWKKLKQKRHKKTGQLIVKELMGKKAMTQDTRRVVIRKQYTGSIMAGVTFSERKRIAEEEQSMKKKKRSKSKNVYNVREMRPACPMLRISLIPLRMNLDLMIYNQQRDEIMIHTGQLLMKICELDPRIRPLLISVIEWSKARLLCDKNDTYLDHITVSDMQNVFDFDPSECRGSCEQRMKEFERRQRGMKPNSGAHQNGLDHRRHHPLNRRMLSTLAWFTIVIKFLQSQSDPWNVASDDDDGDQIEYDLDGNEVIREVWHPLIPAVRLDTDSGDLLCKHRHLCVETMIRPVQKNANNNDDDNDDDEHKNEDDQQPKKETTEEEEVIVPRNRRSVIELMNEFFKFLQWFDFETYQIDINDSELLCRSEIAIDKDGDNVDSDLDDDDDEDTKMKEESKKKNGWIVGWKVLHPLKSSINLTEHIHQWSSLILKKEFDRACELFDNVDEHFNVVRLDENQKKKKQHNNNDDELKEITDESSDKMMRMSVFHELIQRMQLKSMEITQDSNVEEKILVFANIPKRVTKEEFESKINQVCRPLSIEFESGMNKAYVCYSEPRMAHLARAELNHTLLKGRRLYIKFAPNLRTLPEQYGVDEQQLRPQKKTVHSAPVSVNNRDQKSTSKIERRIRQQLTNPKKHGV